MEGLGFSSKKKKISRPVVPNISIAVDGKNMELPATPIRSTNENGILGYDFYEVSCQLNSNKIPSITASSDNKKVKVSISQAQKITEPGVVKFDYNGSTKTYLVKFITK